MLTVVALSVSARRGKKEKCSQNVYHESNTTTVCCILHAGETKRLWAMAVWFWEYYDCLNITYNSYSPNAQPLIQRFKMVGRMKTGELALDVLVADILGGGNQWDKHKGSECQSLHLKAWRYKFDHCWLPTLPFKKVSLSPWLKMSGSVFSSSITNDFHLHLFKSTGCESHRKMPY